MLIKSVTVGPLQVNCFIIADEKSKKTLVIDPGDEPDRIMDIINGNGLKVEYIICTHGHFDHVGAVSDLKKETGAKVLIHKDELEIYDAAKDMAALWGYDLDPLPDPDVLANDGDIIEAGDLRFEIFHSPGHSPGGMCLYGHETAITGDTLFAGSIGRTDFHGGDINKLKESFKRLMSLPEGTRVLCGHGPETTIGREKRENMFSGEFLL
ncbi:MAG: MBL fold metallo-hydrolase [Nitrospirae bacterium GWC2_46_6]|nr:MAG: MBL fold metallo-hydrolase [Nitrospirae bacterium GWA2_46_11]OGW23030.1 MAG: MBL fold metallo-hydrolase [Nitrospirae bacterium GWC2_46_6]OGW24534.1 MAG: MBL fold metallo-hydrolase [Nitrospirae bacterium GWB2_47_37]HAK89198.1 MBL fold metallo-hydrolase [Nitrospiraceae bacterium]HCZ12665.1 MBL fold metallo-hydrolase [Nitrospiraceae bacterium]